MNRIMKFFIVGSFCSITALIDCGTSVAADTIRFATGEYPPYTSEENEYPGYVTELVQHVCQQMGMKVSIVHLPWRRCLKYTERGDVWATFPYVYTKERAEVVDFSEPLYRSVSRFYYYNRKKPIVYSNLSDLKKYKVGGILGYYYEELFRENKINAIYSPNEISALKCLQTGIVDVLPMNVDVAGYLLSKHFSDEVNRFIPCEPVFYDDQFRLAVSKRYPDSGKLLIQFNTELGKFKHSNAAIFLQKKYFGN